MSDGTNGTDGTDGKTVSEKITGGCLCGQLRYEASAEPLRQGLCCCADCRKASGSGFIPFMGFAAGALKFKGRVAMHEMRHLDGRVAERNFCPQCGGLVFGGKIGNTRGYTIYAGSLDDPSQFKPQMAIFARDKPEWVVIPAGLVMFDEMPPGPKPQG